MQLLPLLRSALALLSNALALLSNALAAVLQHCTGMCATWYF